MKSKNKTRAQLIKERVAAPYLEGQSPAVLTQRYYTPFRLLMVILVSIFLFEIIIMLLLFLMPPLSTQVEALIDGLVLTVIIFPILYLSLFRPLLIHIAERKRVEKALRESKEQLCLITDALPALVAYVDSAQCYRFNNKAYEEWFGCPRAEVTGKHVKEVLGETAYQVIREHVEAALSGRKVTYEGTLPYKDGKARYVSANYIPHFGGNGEVKGFYVLTSDITERKQMKETLRHSEEQLQHSQVLASLGEMTAGIAHEVNNPLGSIMLYSELLLASNHSSQIKKDLKVIRDEAKRAVKIMTALLTYGRRMKFRMRRLNLHKILNRAMDMRRYQQNVQNITGSINIIKEPLYIRGDLSQLMQVFLNIILNAEEAIREGKGSRGGNIIVTTQNVGEWVKVSIADDGTGLPEENLSQVFYPFFTTKPLGEGTGLGLSSCYGIITEHKGLIHAENNEMGGATFIVELPLAEIRDEKSSPLKHNEAEVVIT